MAWEDLARAVLQQALDDAMSKKTSRFRKHKNPTEQEKVEAIRFLRGTPYYAEWLEYWCQCSGMVESSVRAIGRKLNEENNKKSS